MSSERAKIHVVTWLKTSVHSPGVRPSLSRPSKNPSTARVRPAIATLATMMAAVRPSSRKACVVSLMDVLCPDRRCVSADVEEVEKVE